MPVIIWINGGFGAGKTTLAQELHRRLPDAVVYNPEDVGIMLWKWLPSDGDFQHMASWRELVVATALSLRRELNWVSSMKLSDRLGLTSGAAITLIGGLGVRDD